MRTPFKVRRRLSPVGMIRIGWRCPGSCAIRRLNGRGSDLLQLRRGHTRIVRTLIMRASRHAASD
jgi:hypothetical protein